MKKTKLVFIVILLVVMENVAIWYISNFNYQYKTQEKRTNSKTGQTEVCKTIPDQSDLLSVIEKMDRYSPDLIYTDSMERINISYGSELKGFVTAKGVGFVFDQNYKLIQKSCDTK